MEYSESSEQQTLGRPTEAEALRMVVAFYCIMEPELRARLINLAEDFAMRSPVVEGCTHFMLLEKEDV
jgi:glutamate racemase